MQDREVKILSCEHELALPIMGETSLSKSPKIGGFMDVKHCTKVPTTFVCTLALKKKV